MTDPRVFEQYHQLLSMSCGGAFKCSAVIAIQRNHRTVNGVTHRPASVGPSHYRGARTRNKTLRHIQLISEIIKIYLNLFLYSFIT